MPAENSQSNTIARPPIVGIFGHIDHGKSSLLDYIRKSNVVEKEAGGITQHLSAYEVTRQRVDGHLSKITFLDTPGHEAFQNIRTRGASAADIAILVVSGEDGVKPQTLEVYKFIEEVKLPYLVAVTKMDKPSANLDRVKQSLAENGILVEGYGGDIPMAAVSAKTGVGVDELLDLISLMAEMKEIKGDPEEMGEGVIIESRLDHKRGITATCVIKNGTVRKGAFAAGGGAWAPLRFLIDSDGNNAEELTFSAPVQIVGWDKLPRVGVEFKTFLKKDEAIEYANSQPTTNNQQPIHPDEAKVTLPIILKADTAGSLEAVENEIGKLSRERIALKIISSGVGSVSENDVKLALTTPGTTLLGFHTKADRQAESLAERKAISIQLFDIIYELTDLVRKLLEEREPRIEVEEVTGAAKVLKIFSATKNKQVIGARVLSGQFAIGNSIKIMRREADIGRGKVRELQQAKVATQEVAEGSEFGALIESKIEIAPGDALEAVAMVTK
jgi:translation initiation factor IF-2